MNVKQLVLELQECGGQETAKLLLRYPELASIEVKHVRCLEPTEEISANIKQVLYLSEGGAFEILPKECGALLPLEEGELLQKYRYAAMIGNILTLDWQQRYDIFTEINLKLNDISLKEPDIEALVRYYNRITSNSVVIYDEFFNITVTTNPDLADYDREESTLEKCVLANLFYYKQEITYEDSKKGRRSCRRLLFPVLIRGSDPTPRGYLAIFDTGIPHERTDQATLELFANSALTEMRRLLDLRNIEEKYVSDFLYDLIFRKTDKREEIIRRARMLNVSEQADYCIIALKAGAAGEEFRIDTNGYITKYEYLGDRIMNGVALKIHEKCQKDVVTKFDRTILILHRMHQYSRQEDYHDVKILCQWMESSLRPLFSECRFQIGIGTIVDRLEKISSSYHHAQFALSYGRVLYARTEPYMIAYNESGLLKIFSVLQETDTLKDIIPENLLRIREYDQKGNSSLYETLKVYLSNNCNAKKASQQLFVHYKTMIYRLEKLQREFDIQLDNNNLRFHIELGIQLLEILDIKEEK